MLLFNMKNFRRLLILLAAILSVWIILTIWVEIEGPYHKLEIGVNSQTHRALIVYDPDPIYNLDQQVCESFGQALANNEWRVIIATVAAAKKIKDTSFQLYVFCANTYNWSPDWSITRFLKTHAAIQNKNVVGITLGGGSTSSSQKILEKIIQDKNGKLISSKAFWLWRPNDEARSKEPNVSVAVDMIETWAKQITRDVK